MVYIAYSISNQNYMVSCGDFRLLFVLFCCCYCLGVEFPLSCGIILHTIFIFRASCGILDCLLVCVFLWGSV